MTWQNLCALGIGAAVAVVGSLHDKASLVALAMTIVGGVLGGSIPARASHAAEAPPTSPPGITRRRRRRATPGGTFAPDMTLRNRLPGGSAE